MRHQKKLTDWNGKRKYHTNAKELIIMSDMGYEYLREAEKIKGRVDMLKAIVSDIGSISRSKANEIWFRITRLERMYYECNIIGKNLIMRAERVQAS